MLHCENQSATTLRDAVWYQLFCHFEYYKPPRCLRTFKCNDQNICLLLHWADRQGYFFIKRQNFTLTSRQSSRQNKHQWYVSLVQHNLNSENVTNKFSDKMSFSRKCNVKHINWNIIFKRTLRYNCTHEDLPVQQANTVYTTITSIKLKLRFITVNTSHRLTPITVVQSE